MARGIFCIACDSAIIDRTTNKLSLINIVEQVDLSLKDGPSNLNIWGNSNLPIHICTYWTRSAIDEPESVRARLRFISHNGNELDATLEFEPDLVSSANCRSTLILPNFPVYMSYGRHQQMLVVEQFENNKWVEAMRSAIMVITEKE